MWMSWLQLLSFTLFSLLALNKGLAGNQAIADGLGQLPGHFTAQGMASGSAIAAQPSTLAAQPSTLAAATGRHTGPLSEQVDSQLELGQEVTTGSNPTAALASANVDHGSERALLQHSTSNPAKFCIVMFVFQWKEVLGQMANQSITEKKLYADYHGYDLRVMRKEKQSSMISTYFSKMTSVIENMDGSCEWIWCLGAGGTAGVVKMDWFAVRYSECNEMVQKFVMESVEGDLDTIIMSPSISLEAILEMAKEHGSHFVPPAVQHAEMVRELKQRGEAAPPLPHSTGPKGIHDMDGVDLVVADRCGIINIGSFLLRVTTWSKKFMNHVVNLEGEVTREEIPSVCTGRCYDQTAMSHLLIKAANHTDDHRKIAYVPARMLNGMPSDGNRCRIKHYEWQPGDFLVHFAGGNSKTLFPKYWDSPDRLPLPSTLSK